MKYVGLHTQIRRNNIRSIILLILFPFVMLALVWIFLYFVARESGHTVYEANATYLRFIPWITLAVFTWFIIAYLFHTAMIRKATGSVPLERRDNKRIYNLVENLCIGSGMKMPKINLIEDDSLNAFASGINTPTFTISLSRGIISKLNDEELESVIAHELTHIRNRDVRLLIISIIFVGIFAFVTEALFRFVQYGGGGRGKKGNGGIVLIALLLAAVGYLFSTLFRFALSKKREYLADAGSASMTKNPLALASALEKISADSRIEAVKRKDVAQLFIDNPGEKSVGKSFSLAFLFATHPPIEKRIEILRQF